MYWMSTLKLIYNIYYTYTMIDVKMTDFSDGTLCYVQWQSDYMYLLMRISVSCAYTTIKYEHLR